MEINWLLFRGIGNPESVDANAAARPDVETYPIDPKPVTVERILFLVTGISPLKEDTNSCCELNVIALAIPATSKAVPGVAV